MGMPCKPCTALKLFMHFTPLVSLACQASPREVSAVKGSLKMYLDCCSCLNPDAATQKL